MRNVSVKSYRENQNTLLSPIIFFFENRVVCEVMWKNIVVPGKPQMSLRRVRIGRCMPKATNTRSKYVILTVFRRLQWLHERV